MNAFILDGESISILQIFLDALFWIYDKVRNRLFPPNPLSLYALMLDCIERQIEFERVMKEKGFKFE